MKAYKVTNINLDSCIIPPNSKFYQQYGFEHTVDIGLVFDTLENAEIFAKDIDKFLRIFQVECSHVEPCDELVLIPMSITVSAGVDNFIDLFQKGNGVVTCSLPFKGSLWGFDIRLVKEIKR
jgi:hypothetical protein